MLTCTGPLSRNRTVGVELGRGRQLPEIIASLNGKVAEGIRSTTAALGLAARYSVEMPITEQMDAILHHGKNPREAIRDLMSASRSRRIDTNRLIFLYADRCVGTSL